MNTVFNDVQEIAKQKHLDLSDSFEKIPCEIFPDVLSGSKYVANKIAHLIKGKQEKGLPCVLGLATGFTPLSLYADLVRLHRKEGRILLPTAWGRRSRI